MANKRLIEGIVMFGTQIFVLCISQTIRKIKKPKLMDSFVVLNYSFQLNESEEIAIQDSCKSGKLKPAQWLLEIKLH